MAWRVLEAVGDGAYADLALERELKRSKLSPRDRGLATELAYGAIRQRRRLDAWLDRLGKVPAEHLPGHAYHTYALTSGDGTVTFELRHNVNGRSTVTDVSTATPW